MFEIETDSKAKSLLKRIAEANKLSMTESIPEIGIFWIDTSNNKLIKFSTPWTDCMSDHGMYDVGITHHTFWSRNKGRFGNYSSVEYEDLPRGRIIYDRHNNTFKIYLNSKLGTNKKYRDMIIKEFRLGSNVRFLKDEHYE